MGWVFFSWVVQFHVLWGISRLYNGSLFCIRLLLLFYGTWFFFGFNFWGSLSGMVSFVLVLCARGHFLALSFLSVLLRMLCGCVTLSGSVGWGAFFDWGVFGLGNWDLSSPGCSSPGLAGQVAVGIGPPLGFWMDDCLATTPGYMALGLAVGGWFSLFAGITTSA